MEKENQYLMLHRVIKKNDVNHDKWIGVGGHFEQDESPEECILREVKEETGLTLTDYRYRGLVTFVSGAGLNEYMHLFTATGWEGTSHPCDEGILEWIPKEDLRQLNIWEGDRIFLRLLEERQEFFSLKLVYDGGDGLVYAALDGKPMELLDVLDENGNPTGIRRERNVCHRDGSPHATVHIWVIRNSEGGQTEVLLQKRSTDKDSNPGAFDASAAGHVSAGSGIRESAVRELGEELGIYDGEDELKLIGRHPGRFKSQFHGLPFVDNEDVSVFLYQKPVQEKDLCLQKSEVAGVRWMEMEECSRAIREGNLDTCIYPDEFRMIREYLRGKQ